MKDVAVFLAVVVVASALPELGRAYQRAWEDENNCQVIGYTDSGIYPTNPRRARLGCDCGYFLRPTE